MLPSLDSAEMSRALVRLRSGDGVGLRSIINFKRTFSFDLKRFRFINQKSVRMRVILLQSKAVNDAGVSGAARTNVHLLHADFEENLKIKNKMQK